MPFSIAASGLAATSICILAYALTYRARILLALVVQALKAPGNVFDLPTLVRANLIALHSAAGAQSLLGTQFVNLGCDRKIFEVGQVSSPPAPLHPSRFVLRLGLRGCIFGMDRLGL